MALKPENEAHEKQINAGTIGRKKGHKFESILADEINNHMTAINVEPMVEIAEEHLFTGNPARFLLYYIALKEKISIKDVHAWWLGGLATSGQGDTLRDENGNQITKCKSDVLIEIESNKGKLKKGVSVKTCSKKVPTNDQMYFTTASAFCNLLEDNGIHVSNAARKGMSQFCGDEGFRPMDLMNKSQLSTRKSDPRRYYWEELSEESLNDWRRIFSEYQDAITRLLFQKAYKNDPYPPDYVLHQRVKYESFDECPIALFTIDEIVKLSHDYSGYVEVPYKIHKGTYKDDETEHLAPRFGFIQFQRGGQKQHPTQLQFNLKAGYFNHLPE